MALFYKQGTREPQRLTDQDGALLTGRAGLELGDTGLEAWWPLDSVPAASPEDPLEATRQEWRGVGGSQAHEVDALSISTRCFRGREAWLGLSQSDTWAGVARLPHTVLDTLCHILEPQFSHLQSWPSVVYLTGSL